MTTQVAISPKTIQRPSPASPSTADLIARKTAALQADTTDRSCIPADRALTAAERNILASRSALLGGALQASPPDVIAARLYALVGVLPSPNTDSGNAAAKVGIYQVALATLPAWAVIEACDMALRGKVGSSGGRFLPAPGELFEAAEKLVSAVAREKARLDRLLMARIEQHQPSPEERAAAVARVRGLVAKTIDKNVVTKNEQAILDAGGHLDDLGMVKKPARDERTEQQRRDEAERHLERMKADGFVPKPSKHLLEKIGATR